MVEEIGLGVVPPDDQYELVDVPDIPLPMEAESGTIADGFNGSVKFAIVGIGQGGCRIAETFWNLGYRRVGVINTSYQDIKTIAVPEQNKFLVDAGGAGKDMETARKLVNDHYEDIMDFLRKCFGDSFDRVLICAGAGGGTGAGGLQVVIDICHDLLHSLGIEAENECKVGVILALPTNAEGQKVAANSIITINNLVSLVEKADEGHMMVSPLIFLDNQRVKEIFPKLSVNAFWATANKSVCMLLHIFNAVSFMESPFTSFDKADYLGVLNSGIITFGATPVLNWDDPSNISYAIRDNLKNNVLVGGMDLKNGRVAGCIVIGGKEILGQIPQEDLEHGFEQLSRTLGNGSTVHRGIYPGNKDSLVVYTVIGGLRGPVDRIIELKNIAKL